MENPEQTAHNNYARELIDVHQKALDDIVNVNSLFTIAVFVGLSFAAPHQRSLENREECNPDPEMAKRLILYEVTSFACFLLSSLGAKALKVLLNLKIIKKKLKPIPKFQSAFKILLSDTWRRFLLALSIVSSFVGVVLLMLSMIEVIQIRVGKLGCGSYYAMQSVGILCAVVLTALLLYAPSMVYAVIATATDLP
ncbi:maternal effect embryo arrest 60 [Melia azedarach]|uniref:Maternal effect embryo arrest 60 n=2 Tax=Melia azedarach TaxID=155640 RepID=A0ACC1Z2S7_MELAZ|nr:maternal effect embryo arrest 60 [Melia azedarach]KAJ4730361.1 maternal effect embryo arrest 60 [Melia azedarach]